MKVCFPEGDDSRIIAAAKELAQSPTYRPVLMQRSIPVAADTKSKPDDRIECLSCAGLELSQVYARALQLLDSGTVQMILAGVTTRKAELLSLILKTFKKALRDSKAPLFSIAEVTWKRAKETTRFCIMDPSVVEDPSPHELACMVSTALPVVRQMLDERPYACMLSYVTGEDSRPFSQKQRDVIKLLAGEGETDVCPIVARLQRSESRANPSHSIPGPHWGSLAAPGPSAVPGHGTVSWCTLAGHARALPPLFKAPPSSR